MFRFITRRRRAERQRVDAFLHAIELSGRYSVDPDWTLQTVDEQPWLGSSRTDTAWLPRIVLAGTPLL